MNGPESQRHGLSALSREFEEFNTQFGIKTPFPPPCFTTLGGTFLDYESRTSLKVSFPVLKETLNPQAQMQGGFITAAFDNVFGPLSYLAARCRCTTLDVHTQFLRPIDEGDTLLITARVVARGPNSIHMTAEAMNSANKLIATSNTNLLIVHL